MWLIGGENVVYILLIIMIEEGVSNRGVSNLNGEDNQICLSGDCLFISTLTTWGRGGVRWRGGRGGGRGGENVERPI